MGQTNNAPVVNIADMSLNVILENKNLAKNFEFTITKKKRLMLKDLRLSRKKTLLCMAYYFS